MSRDREPSRRGRRVRTLLLLAGALLLPPAGGCHPRFPFESPAGEAEGRRADLARRWEGVASLRGEARVSLAAAGSVYPGSMTLVMKKPGRARVDFFDPFGNPRGVVVIAGERIGKLLPPVGPEGEPPETVLLDRLRLLAGGAPGEELAGLLAGLPAAGLLGSGLRWAGADEADASRPGAVLAQWEGFPVLAAFTPPDPAGDDPAAVLYREYRLCGGVPLPRRVAVRFPRREWLLDITWRSVELNVELDDELFVGIPR